ncbi:DsbA family protein [Cellulomonas soli]|uniref:DsbA family protein n=1 Tax=Cellulomonas soli TaxID=931535 RepID=UPI003F84F6E0
MSAPETAGAGPVLPDRHVYGERGAPVTVVEYGDLECPYCRAAAPVLRTLVETSDGQVRLVWRHFPLFEVHPYALTAALAAEAAATHGQFWAMHDRLFAHQDRLTDADLRGHARALGLDPDEVAGDGAQRYAPAVEADYLSGLALDVRATPTLLVGHQHLHGLVDLETLRSAVRAVLDGDGQSGAGEGRGAAPTEPVPVQLGTRPATTGDACGTMDG